jgi:hypothetical protein
MLIDCLPASEIISDEPTHWTRPDWGHTDTDRCRSGEPLDRMPFNRFRRWEHKFIGIRRTARPPGITTITNTARCRLPFDIWHGTWPPEFRSVSLTA